MATGNSRPVPSAMALLLVLSLCIARAYAESHFLVNDVRLANEYGVSNPLYGLSYAVGTGGYVYDPKIVSPYFDQPQPNTMRIVNADGYIILKKDSSVRLEYGHCMQKPGAKPLSCFCYGSATARTNKNCGNAVASSYCINDFGGKFVLNDGAQQTYTGDYLDIKMKKDGSSGGVAGADPIKIEKLAWFAGASEVSAIKVVSPYPPKGVSTVSSCSSFVIDTTKALFVGNLIGGNLKSSNVHPVAFTGTVNSSIRKPSCERRKKHCEKICEKQKDAGIVKKSGGGICRRRAAKNVLLGAGAAYVGQRVIL